MSDIGKNRIFMMKWVLYPLRYSIDNFFIDFLKNFGGFKIKNLSDL